MKKRAHVFSKGQLWMLLIYIFFILLISFSFFFWYFFLACQVEILGSLFTEYSFSGRHMFRQK